MKHNVYTLRLPAAVSVEVEGQAARRGISRTSWAAHLVERGLFAESVAKIAAGEGVHGGAAPPRLGAGIPASVLERGLFAVCFSEALLKKLNASLNRSTSELGTVAAQARDQAQAETAALLKALGE